MRKLKVSGDASFESLIGCVVLCGKLVAVSPPPIGERRRFRSEVPSATHPAVVFRFLWLPNPNPNQVCAETQ